MLPLIGLEMKQDSKAQDLRVTVMNADACREPTSLVARGAATHRPSLATCQEPKAGSPRKEELHSYACQEEKREQAVEKGPKKIVHQASQSDTFLIQISNSQIHHIIEKTQTVEAMILA